MRIFIAILFSLIALSLRVYFSDILSIGGFSLNPIILLLYFITLYWNGFYGLYLSFILGIIYGSFFSVNAGFYSLIFSSLSFCVIIIREKIYRYEYRSLIILFIVTFLAGFFELLTYNLKARWFFLSLCTHVLPESIFTTVVGFGILYIIKRIR